MRRDVDHAHALTEHEAIADSDGHRIRSALVALLRLVAMRHNEQPSACGNQSR
jgi:hypothetical protein